MSTPEREDVQIFNDLVNQINGIVELSNKKPNQVPMRVKRLSRETESVRNKLGEHFYFILKGIIAGFENKVDGVHYFFSSALEIEPSTQAYTQYIKTLINCSENTAAYELACSVYERDGTIPEIYALIGESAMQSGLLKTGLEWLQRYEKSTKSAHRFREQLENYLSYMPNIDENALSEYMNSAILFMRERGVKPIEQSFNSMLAEDDMLEVFFYTNFSVEESTQAFYDFVTSDYILNISDEILDHVTINFIPYAR